MEDLTLTVDRHAPPVVDEACLSTPGRVGHTRSSWVTASLTSTLGSITYKFPGTMKRACERPGE